MSLDSAVETVVATREWARTSQGKAILLEHEGLEQAATWKGAGRAKTVAFLAGLNSRLYWVSAEMLDLVEHAASSLPDEPLCPEELPCPVGCCLTERSIRADEVTHEGDMRGWCWASMPATALHPAYLLITAFGLDVEAGLLFPVSADCIDYGDRPLSVLNEDLRGPDDVPRRAMPRTFWKLAQQRIASNSPGLPSRATRRRLEKAGLEIPTSTVVTLRAFAGQHAEPGDGAVDWTHRWVVSGHWRQQWLPSVRAHRAQWIVPYVKGPESKPLVLKDRRYALVR